MRAIYSLFAVILPVTLGLGLIYLYVMERLPVMGVFMVVAFMIVVIVGVPLVVRRLRDGEDYDKADQLR